MIIRNTPTLIKFQRYKRDLCAIDIGPRGYIFSREICVAEIDYQEGTAIQLGWWGIGEQAHINYACRELGLKLDRNGF